LTKLAYAHDGISIYDKLFLDSLKEKYEVYVLTFHPSPTCIPKKIKVIKLKDFLPQTELHPYEGIRKHLLTPIRVQLFKKNLKRVKPDILMGAWASTYGFYSAYSNFHPFILLVWGSDVLILPKKYFPLKSFVVYSLRKADIVIVDSEVQKEAAIKLGCEPRKIVKFPWVDLTGFEKSERQRKKLREELGWSEDDIVVISLRNHRSIYGVEYLIDAIPSIVKENKKVKFLILGEGPLTKVFKTRTRLFIRSGYVRFVGMVPHERVADYLSAADIYVSTSFSDGTSASLLEAMACSLSPIVTEIHGNKEWVKDGVNGLLVPVADSKKLAEKILLLANNCELRRRLQVKAKETIKMRVNWRRNISLLMRILDKISLDDK